MCVCVGVCLCALLETFSSIECRVGNGKTKDERRKSVANGRKQIFANASSLTSSIDHLGMNHTHTHYLRRKEGKKMEP